MNASCEAHKLTPLQLDYIHCVYIGLDLKRRDRLGRETLRVHWKSWHDLFKRGLLRTTGTGTFNDWYKVELTPCTLDFVPLRTIRHAQTEFDWPEVVRPCDRKSRWWDHARRAGWKPPIKRTKRT